MYLIEVIQGIKVVAYILICVASILLVLLITNNDPSKLKSHFKFLIKALAILVSLVVLIPSYDLMLLWSR